MGLTVARMAYFSCTIWAVSRSICSISWISVMGLFDHKGRRELKEDVNYGSYGSYGNYGNYGTEAIL